MTATNVTVSTNGPRSQVKPGHPGPLAFFFPNRHFFQLTIFFPTNNMFPQPTKNLFFQMTNFCSSPPLSIGARGFTPASAVFRSCFPGNLIIPEISRISQGKISIRHCFFNRQFFSNNYYVTTTDKKPFFPKDTLFFFPPPPIGPTGISPASAVSRSCFPGNLDIPDISVFGRGNSPFDIFFSTNNFLSNQQYVSPTDKKPFFPNDELFFFSPPPYRP